MFHMPQYVPRSVGANQLVRMRAQAGPPVPWRKPFMAHQKQNQYMDDPNPNMMLIPAVAIRPDPSKTPGESFAPRTPAMNLEHPYAIGKMEVIAPIMVISIPRPGVATMTGAV
jgi:hypothetical protein